MELPYGEGTIEVDLGPYDATVAEPAGGDPVDARAAAEAAIDDPHGPELGDVASPDDQVAVVVTDVTRDTPDDVLLDVLLDRLPVPRENVRVVIGLGLHRPMTDAEIRDGLGKHADLAVNHEPEAAVEVGTIERVGDADESVSVEVHPAVASADLVLATGMVEPHQYAGFSGGAKTVVIGAGSESMIRYTHGPEMLSEPGVRLGRIDGNPFREALDQAGDIAGPDFCVNVTEGPEGILGVAAGRPRDVVAELAATARDALAVELDPDRRFDAAITCVPAPKDANLYQASRAATYLLLGAHNPVRQGGRVVIPARIPEGAGEGTGEQRFYRRFSEASSPKALYEAMQTGYEPGAQRAFVVARAMLSADVHVTNCDHPEVVSDCLMTPHESVVGALEPGSSVLVVPDALHTLVTASE